MLWSYYVLRHTDMHAPWFYVNTYLSDPTKNCSFGDIICSDPNSIDALIFMIWPNLYEDMGQCMQENSINGP